MKKVLIILVLFFICLTSCAKTKPMYKYSYQVSKDKSYQQESKPQEKPSDDKKSSQVQTDLQPIHGQLSKEVKDLSLSGEVLEIGEKLFITQINDIYYNFEDYKDKTIVVEGMFTYLTNFKKEKKPAVYRRGPGCCNNDGWGGFILELNQDPPKDNDWIRVSGKLKLVTDKSGRYRDLYLVADEIIVKEQRGLEEVLQ